MLVLEWYYGAAQAYKPSTGYLRSSSAPSPGQYPPRSTAPYLPSYRRSPTGIATSTGRHLAVNGLNCLISRTNSSRCTAHSDHP